MFNGKSPFLSTKEDYEDISAGFEFVFSDLGENS